jgi:predicted DNA binding CopG/RHH family protein
MKHRKVKYTNEPIGKIKIVKDFLPPPDELVLKEDTIKVTLALSKSSVDFFKDLAHKKHTQYQKMIRVLLDKYAAHFDS